MNDFIDPIALKMYVFLHPYEGVVVDEKDWAHFLYVYDAEMKYTVDWDTFHDPAYKKYEVVRNEARDCNVNRWAIPIKLKAN